MKLNNILRFIDNDYTIDPTTITPVDWRSGPSTDTSGLMLSMSQAGFVQFPKIFENTITDLRATGNIKLLSNTRLKNQLVIYYNQEKVYDDWNASYLPNRTAIDMVMNRIMPVEPRIAYTLHDDAEFKAALTV